MKIVESIKSLEMSEWIKSLFIFAIVLGCCFLFSFSASACGGEIVKGGGGSVPEPSSLVLLFTAGGTIYIAGLMYKNKKKK